jgi:type I restriction enzyme S subunit
MAKWFFEKFELIANVPHAVARMRGLLLDMAATGRLLPHEGKWETHSLKSLATKIGSGATPAGGRESYFAEGVPLIRSMNVHFRGFERTGLVFLSDEQADELANVAVQPNDVLLNITGASIGRVTIAPEDMAGARVNQHVTIIRPTSRLSSRFLSIFLASPSIQRMIDEIQVGATRQALTKGMIEQFTIPLPPLAEQKRIVAKVDELMALCDELEAQQREREERKAKLVQASLARFAAAPTPDNLQFLFHNSYVIPPADLRKMILTLAVQGKLVRQEAGVSAEDGTCGPQDNWAQVTLQDVAQITMGNSPPGESYNTQGMGVPLINGPVEFSPGHFGFTLKTKFTTAPTRLCRRGELLICVRGSTTGRTNIAAFDACIGRGVAAINAAENQNYVNLVVWSLRDYIFSLGTGTAFPSVSFNDLATLRFLLPPLRQQSLIVAKVNQMMALVDELERQLEESRATGTKLLEAIVRELTGGK